MQSLWKTVWRFLRKLKIELPYDPAVPLLGIYPERPTKTKELICKDTHTSMFIAALFIIAKMWKQPKCPSADEWIKKMWYIYNGILLSCKKRMKFLPFATTWMELEGIILSELCQTENNKYHMISLLCGI